MEITKAIKNDKTGLLQYFQERAREFHAEANRQWGSTAFKKKAKKLNALLISARQTLIEIIQQKAKKNDWTDRDLLESVLMVTYCHYVVILETRHSVWPYEYMAFSRRIGEL